jgi:hypothetical protein
MDVLRILISHWWWWVAAWRALSGLEPVGVKQAAAAAVAGTLWWWCLEAVLAGSQSPSLKERKKERKKGRKNERKKKSWSSLV